MKILASIFRVLLVAMTIAAVNPAVAANAKTAASAYSPVGIWDLKVGGIFEGEAVKGQAFVEFDSAGNLSGHYLSRMSIEVFDIVGTWNQDEKKFSGYIEVYDSNGIYAAFAMTGSARTNVSIGARLTDPANNRLSLIGKPFLATVDLTGLYFGTIRQYGMDGYVAVTLDQVGLGQYEVSGSLSYLGSTNELIGQAMVNRTGKFTAYVLNLDTGVYSCFWGTTSPTGMFSGSGRSLSDGSSIRLRINPSL